MKHLVIGNDGNNHAVTLLPDVVTSTLVVYGGKGMGKTNFGSVLIEELSKASLRWSYLDPLGVAWGLRHSADGRGAGVECVILGGAHGDIPIEPTGGAVVADLVVDEASSVVIDFSRKPSGEMWTIGEKVRFITEYTRRVFQRQGSLVNGHRREPFFQILDEAARYVPQTIPHGNPQLAECLSAWETLVEEGRNIGIGVGLLTQRSARMAKSVSEVADAMFSFRIVGPNSIGAVMDWLGEHVAKDRIKTLVETLRSLERGRCLLVSPGWLRLEEVVNIRARETFDSSATPKPGERPRSVTGEGAKPDLEKYSVRMKDTIERARENDPSELKKKLRELETKLRSAERTAPAKAAPPEASRKISAAELADVIQPIIEQYQAAVAKASNDWKDAVLGALNRMPKAAIDWQRPLHRAAAALNRQKVSGAEIQGRSGPRNAQPRHPTQSDVLHPLPDNNAETNGDGPKLKAGARAILIVLAQGHPRLRSADELKVLVGAARRTMSDYVGILKRAGYIYERGGEIGITGDGMAAAGNVEPEPQSTGDLVAMWKRKFKAGVGKMLDVIVDRYPAALSRDELKQESGVTAERTFGDYLGILRRAKLLDEKADGFKAADSLFP